MILNQSNTPWYKQRWPWILMAGPAVVIVAGIVTAWLAVTSSDGLVSDDYYKEGLAVNQSLQRDHEAASLGLRADLMRAGLNLRLLVVAESVKEFPATLTLKLAHPTIAGRDQTIKLNSEGNGFYAGQLATAIGGRWLVSIEDPSGEWRLQGDWQADSGEPLRLSAKTGK